MQVRLRRPAGTHLFACAVLAASPAAPIAEIRLPFDPLPGAIYLGLMAWPAFFGGGEPARLGHDLQLAAYGGPAYTMASPVSFTQPGGTELRFESVPWAGQPFKPPPYYGLRGIVWAANGRQGVMLDFTHIKAKALKHSRVEQSGTRDGRPVPPHEKLSATFSKLEFTHGYNILTLNAMRRRAPAAGKLVAYAGAGGGIAIPHVEVGRAGWRAKTRTSEYQLSGPAAQILGGVEWRFSPRLSLFVEYKLSCSLISGAVKGGGRVETNLCTHQLLAGPAWRLKAAAAP
jgi:hypothetical protein